MVVIFQEGEGGRFEEKLRTYLIKHCAGLRTRPNTHNDSTRSGAAVYLHVHVRRRAKCVQKGRKDVGEEVICTGLKKRVFVDARREGSSRTGSRQDGGPSGSGRQGGSRVGIGSASDLHHHTAPAVHHHPPPTPSSFTSPPLRYTFIRVSRVVACPACASCSGSRALLDVAARLAPPLSS